MATKHMANIQQVQPINIRYKLNVKKKFKSLFSTYSIKSLKFVQMQNFHLLILM